MPASISDLVGYAKQSSDLESHPMRIRYNESQVVNAGQYFRMTFPKVADDMLDLRSIRMRATIAITSTDPTCFFDVSDIRAVFNRMRCLSGSQVLMDISELSLLFQTEALIETSLNDNLYEKYLTGRETPANRQAFPKTREYIFSIAPLGSLLNTDALLPLSRLSDTHVEFWLETPQRVLYSGFDKSPTFRLEQVELLCDYIRSPSISQYFASNPLSFHVTDYSHRYNALLTLQSLARFSSAHTSLNKILTIMRPQTRVSGFDIFDKMGNWCPGTDTREYNVHVNNQLFYEQAVDSTEQAFLHFARAFPMLCKSAHFDQGFNTNKHLICVDVTAAPAAFQKEISSGKRTANLNSDIVLKIEFTDTPAEAIRADSYLMSDALIYLDGMKGDLKIRY